MRFFFALIFLVGVYSVQCQLVVPQINRLDTLDTIQPQIKNFLNQLDKVLPHLTSFLSNSEIQLVKNEIVQTILSNIGNKLDINAIKDLLRPILQRILKYHTNARFNLEAIIQHIAQSTVQSLPSIVLGLLSKRDVSEARLDLSNLATFASNLQLENYIPHITEMLSTDKLQQLYTQMMSTGVFALMNQWNSNTVAQAVQQLVSQFVPQLAQSRFDIDWNNLGNSLLQGLVAAAPAALFGLLGKRDLSFNPQMLLSELSVDKIGQIVQVIRSGDRATALLKLRKLLEKFLPGYQGRFNFDELANNLINHVNTLLPPLSQSFLSSMTG